MLDNFTAVHYINKVGGTKSSALSAISGDFVAWCEKRFLSVEAIHLPEVLNVLAGQQSRMRNESSDWKLQADAFQKMFALWGHRIDLFASAWNGQLDLIISWGPQPEAMAVDAFSLNWISLKGYAFPPFNLVSKLWHRFGKRNRGGQQ